MHSSRSLSKRSVSPVSQSALAAKKGLIFKLNFPKPVFYKKPVSFTQPVFMKKPEFLYLHGSFFCDICDTTIAKSHVNQHNLTAKHLAFKSLRQPQKTTSQQAKRAAYLPMKFKSGYVGIQSRGDACYACGVTEAVYWRPSWVLGKRLCNACGIRFMKYGKHCPRCLYVPIGVELRQHVCLKCCGDSGGPVHFVH
jgi:hypothetical protein